MKTNARSGAPARSHFVEPTVQPSVSRTNTHELTAQFHARDSRLKLSCMAGTQIRATKKGIMRLILLIILILLVIGALPTWPYSTGWGYYPSGGLGLLLLIVLLIILLR